MSAHCPCHGGVLSVTRTQAKPEPLVPPRHHTPTRHGTTRITYTLAAGRTAFHRAGQNLAQPAQAAVNGRDAPRTQARASHPCPVIHSEWTVMSTHARDILLCDSPRVHGSIHGCGGRGKTNLRRSVGPCLPYSCTHEASCHSRRAYPFGDSLPDVE